MAGVVEPSGGRNARQAGFEDRWGLALPRLLGLSAAAVRKVPALRQPRHSRLFVSARAARFYRLVVIAYYRR